MSRPLVDYATPRATIDFAGFDADKPIAGLYRHRLRSGGVAVAVEIFFGPPINPDFDPAGDEPEYLDRSPRWQARINGDPVEIDEVWPACAAKPIGREEADHLASLQRWGVEHGHVALADPRRALSPLESPLMF